ncbi:MAG TPA: nitroreductase [Caulobacteraceae bacterium]|nr:nitroreductase [Caulobacteraceae bacterium]
MNIALPAQPIFGAPLPIGERRREVLDFLALRRSASAATLRAPAPDDAELAELLRLAARVPDHGKLFPWRFIVLEGEAKAVFTAGLEDLAARQPNPDKAKGALFKIRTPPLTVAVVSRHIEATIPEREQRLSAAAVCMTLLIAAEAAGYGANWITDWYAYAPEATALLGLGEGEQVAGFIHIGTPAEPPLERVRPDVPSLTTRWAAP